MANYDNIFVKDSNGFQKVATSSDAIVAGPSFSADSISDGTGTVDFGAAGALQTSGIASYDLNVTGAYTADVGSMSLDSTDTTNLTMTANDAGGKTLTIAATNGGAGVANLEMSAGGEIDLTADDVDINATGIVTLDAGGAVSIAAAAASDFTVVGADLTLTTTTSGEIDITSAGLVDINAAANLDIDVTGTFDVLATGAMSLDATGASNITVASGALTLATTTSGDIDITAAQVLDIDAASATIDTTGALDITAGAASKITIADNTSAALDITEGANSYLSFDTSNGQEGITHSKILYAGAKDGTAFMGQMGFVAGETITAANVVALDYDTDGARVFTCQADDAETVRKNAYGVSLAGDTAGNEIPLAISGIVSVVCTDAVAATGAEIGGFVYVDDGAKAGQVTVNAPASGRVYKVGILVGGNGSTADTAVLVALQPQFLYDN